MKNPYHHWVIPAGLYLVVQTVYWLTLYPTVAYGDSGTLTSVAYTLGIAHPPGYPLYTLLANLFSRIPFGSIAWRVNLASAFFGAAAAAVLYMVMMRLTKNTWASLLSAGLYAFSPVIWHHALLAEVFTLNNLFVALIALLALRYVERPGNKHLYLLAYVTGLSLAHHHSVFFWAAPVWIWLALIERRKVLSWKTFCTCALLVLLGLTPYLYLRITALNDPPVVWGDLSSWTEFFRHVRRFRYGTLSLVPGTAGGAADAMRSLWFYFRHIPLQLLVVGVPVGAWGLYKGVRDRTGRGFVLASAAAFILSVGVFHILARLPVEENNQWALHIRKFWVMPNLFLFIWLGIGYHRMMSLKTALRTVQPAVAILAVVLQIAFSFARQDESNNRFFYNDARMKLDPLPGGTLLLTSGDTAEHTVQYLQVCEHMRGDVTAAGLSMLTQYWAGPLAGRLFPNIRLPGDVLMPSPKPAAGTYLISVHGKDVGYRDAYSLSYLFDANIDDHAIYTTKFLRYRDFKNERSWSAAYILLPVGTLNKVMRKGKPIDFDAYLEECVRCSPDLKKIGESPPEKGTWDYLIWTEYWNDYQAQFYALVRAAVQLRAAGPPLRRLASLMETFSAYCPYDLQNPFYWDLGLVYAMIPDDDEASRQKLGDLWRSRLQSSPPPSPEHAALIRKALER